MLWSMRTVCLCAFISRRDRQAHDAPAARYLLSNLKPGQQVLADKAYDADWIRALICEQGAQAVIPSKSNRKVSKSFDRTAYRERNLVERFFGQLRKSFRRIAPHYEKQSQTSWLLSKSPLSEYGTSFISPLSRTESRRRDQSPLSDLPA